MSFGLRSLPLTFSPGSILAFLESVFNSLFLFSICRFRFSKENSKENSNRTKSPSLQVCMPPHPAEEEAPSGIFEKVAKNPSSGTDSTASENDQHKNEHNLPSAQDFHSKGPAIPMTKDGWHSMSWAWATHTYVLLDLPPKSSKEELQARAEELNKWECVDPQAGETVLKGFIFRIKGFILLQALKGIWGFRSCDLMGSCWLVAIGCWPYVHYGNFTRLVEMILQIPRYFVKCMSK